MPLASGDNVMDLSFFFFFSAAKVQIIFEICEFGQNEKIKIPRNGDGIMRRKNEKGK